MMNNYRNHIDQVKAWLRPASQGLSAPQLIYLFEQASCAIWKQGRSTVSSVMMMAVLERVIFNSSEYHPFLSQLKIRESGINFDELHKFGTTLTAPELIEAFQLLIAEFISILGGLTNDVITPALYSELSKVKLEVKLKAIPRTNGENHD